MKQKNALSNLTELKITKLKMHMVFFTLSRACVVFFFCECLSRLKSGVTLTSALSCNYQVAIMYLN